MDKIWLKKYVFATVVGLYIVTCVNFGTHCHAREGKQWKDGDVRHGRPSKHHSPPPPEGRVPPPPEIPVSQPSPAPAPSHKNSTMFNVLDFGAKGDSHTDDTKAFLAAWTAACEVEASIVLVPPGSVFLLKPISFSGHNCKPNIVFQLDGTIVAPTGSNAWGSGLLEWIEFTKLTKIMIRGSGVIDGQGPVWWNQEPTEDNTIVGAELRKMPKIKPTALRFYGSDDVTVTGITIQNSPKAHLKFDSCTNVHVFSINISSPGDSPNTDGIHLQNSKNVLIHDASLASGDDCVSIQTGCSNIYIHDVNCGPGHGISVGGLGRDNTVACVSNITVRDTKISNTMTGVRIKTWQGGSGSAENIVFSNIEVSEVQTPIVIDQFYCDRGRCKNQTSVVAISGVEYRDIRGTYTAQPVYLACSDSLPCTGISLSGIDLEPSREGRHLNGDSFCWDAYGNSETTTVPPVDCLLKGEPSKIPTKPNSCSNF